MRWPAQPKTKTRRIFKMKNTRMTLLALSIFGLWLIAGTSVEGFSFVSSNHRSAVNCSNIDYTPCTCEENRVVCDKVLIKNVKATFSKIPAHDLAGLRFTLSPSEMEPIPDDFLGKTRISGDLVMLCVKNKRLKVSPKAFQLSALGITRVFIDGCDFGQQTNFSYMSGFRNMMALVIKNSTNFKSFKGLPSQSAFTYLYITHSRGFEGLNQDTVALPALKVFYLNFNQLNDATTGKIFKSLAASSLNSLTEIRLDNNKLTKIPEMISSLSQLEQIDLGFNEITVIAKNSLPRNNTAKGLTFSLQRNPIKTIEPGAFGGSIGSGAHVKLEDIRLTRLDSKIFRPMLERMEIRAKNVLGKTPLLFIGNNPIQCDCHLAWLVRDNRNLLKHIEGGKCNDSTELLDLKAADFIRCK
ncbi:hypothetical protein OUZ56_020483 [Daphnia magna]|uniref:Membrane glycoprotein lig-1 n=1 Tax=Daphnia magna TaxID=35525 RepID=A0ABQ9ZEL5_9CRUS|nr:hypothetical protein OUZ56_020483 [Daphnia magna]